MLHYHGTPLGGPRDSGQQKFLEGRHALVSFEHPDDIASVAAFSRSFVIDNGAFSHWRAGKGRIDREGYIEFCRQWYLHPGFDWCVIPDVIDGDEAENDAEVAAWPRDIPAIPVWHLHESLERLQGLASEWRIVAMGSSGKWGTPGTKAWWLRMADALDSICDSHGRPKAQLHGLRMLDWRIFENLPLRSADSANAARNSGDIAKSEIYPPPPRWQRAEKLARSIECHQSSPVWNREKCLKVAMEQFQCGLDLEW